MIYLVSGVSFILGVISGFGLSTILSLMVWAAFWLAVGTVCVLAIDAALGIGRRACGFRVVLRDAFDRGASSYRRWHLRRMVKRYPHLRAMLVPQR
jgi:hypothetical protein